MRPQRRCVTELSRVRRGVNRLELVLSSFISSFHSHSVLYMRQKKWNELCMHSWRCIPQSRYVCSPYRPLHTLVAATHRWARQWKSERVLLGATRRRCRKKRVGTSRSFHPSSTRTRQVSTDSQEGAWNSSRNFNIPMCFRVIYV